MGKTGIKLEKFVLNKKGIIELFTSPEMGAVVREAGEEVARATGHAEDYHVFVVDMPKSNIAIVEIESGNYKAYYNELKTNDLLKGVGAAGLSTHKVEVEKSIPDVLEEML